MRLSPLLVSVGMLVVTGLSAEENQPAVPAALLPATKEAKAQFERGDYVAAEKSYRAILKEAPENLYSWSNLAVVLFRMSKWKEAEDALTHAIQIAPGDGFSHCLSGILYYTEGRNDDALNELAKALAIDPKNATAHNYLGITQSKKGAAAIAQKELETAIALNADYGDALFNLAVVLATKVPPDKENGRKYYERSLKFGAEPDKSLETLIDWTGNTEKLRNPKAAPPGGLMPQPPTPKVEAAPAVKTGPAANAPVLAPELLSLAQEAREQFKRGNYPEAEKIYRQLLEKDPQNISLLSNLGVVLFRAGYLKLSEETFKNAIELAPEDGFSHCTLGIVYYSQGMYDDAVQELTEALTINPQNATAWNYLGITASQKGWNQAAQEALERARKLDLSLDDKAVPANGTPAR